MNSEEIQKDVEARSKKAHKMWDKLRKDVEKKLQVKFIIGLDYGPGAITPALKLKDIKKYEEPKE